MKNLWNKEITEIFTIEDEIAIENGERLAVWIEIMGFNRSSQNWHRSLFPVLLRGAYTRNKIRSAVNRYCTPRGIDLDLRRGSIKVWVSGGLA